MKCWRNVPLGIVHSAITTTWFWAQISVKKLASQQNQVSSRETPCRRLGGIERELHPKSMDTPPRTTEIIVQHKTTLHGSIAETIRIGSTSGERFGSGRQRGAASPRCHDRAPRPIGVRWMQLQGLAILAILAPAIQLPCFAPAHPAPCSILGLPCAIHPPAKRASLVRGGEPPAQASAGARRAAPSGGAPGPKGGCGRCPAAPPPPSRSWIRTRGPGAGRAPGRVDR